MYFSTIKETEKKRNTSIPGLKPIFKRESSVLSVDLLDQTPSPSRSGGLYLQRTGVLCIQEPTDNYHRKRLFILIELCSEGFENHQRRMNSVPHHRLYRMKLSPAKICFFFFHRKVSLENIRLTSGFCHTYRLRSENLGFTITLENPHLCQSLKTISEQEGAILLCFCEAKTCGSFTAESSFSK